MDEDVRKLIRNLRESATTFERQSTHVLPAIDGFIRRHIEEIRQAANQLEQDLQNPAVKRLSGG